MRLSLAASPRNPKTQGFSTPSRTSKTIAAAVVMIMALAFSLDASPAAATTTPGVQATPYNMTYHPWSYNGCSYVPASGTHFGAYYNFHHACIHHDGCYRNRWASKFTCDAWFYNDMMASCAALHSIWSWQRGPCRNRGYLYYVGVFYFGWPAYNNRTVNAPMNAYV
ncbi:MAG: phospholipase A2 [Actinomycetota bacterium]